MMCACHVERSEAKSKHLPKDTIPLGSACSEIPRLRPTGFATNDELAICHHRMGFPQEMGTQNDRYVDSIN